MKKLLWILSSSILTTNSISNLSNFTYNLNNNLQKKLTTTISTNSQKDDLAKLEAWHNSLSIEQDAQANYHN